MPPKTTRKPAVKKKPVKKKQTKSAVQAKKQMWAVVLFALGLLLGFLTLIRGDKLWLAIHNVLFGMFGWSVYFLAPLMLYIAIIAALDKPLSSIKAKLWQMSLLIILISGAIQIFGKGLPAKETVVDNIIALYQGGIVLEGGGIAGAIFSLPLVGLFEKTGASIIIVLLIFVFVMLLTGSTLISLYHYISRPVKEMEEAYAAHVEEKLSAPQPISSIPTLAKNGKKTSSARFDIDVAIDNDPLPIEEPPPPFEDAFMPDHPVRASKASLAEEEEMLSAKDRLMNFGGEKPVEYVSIDEFLPVREVDAYVPPQPEPEPPPPHPLAADILEGCELDTDLLQIIDKFAEKKSMLISIEDLSEGDLPPTIELFDSAAVKPASASAVDNLVQRQYNYPPLNILNQGFSDNNEDITEELKANAQRLVDTLKSFGVQTRITDICRGPSVTRYELQPSAGVKISKITGLSDDIALNLASAGIRIEAPIPNKAAVGIEVPNKIVSMVNIRDIIESSDFKQEQSSLSVALGKDITGKMVLADIGKMPHLLIAGATGSGKSVCINSIIISLLYRSSPDDVKLLMIDPKVVELGVYNAVPHLLVPVVTDPRKAAGALGWAVTEMLGRYKTFAEYGVRDLTGYNRLAQGRDNMVTMPKIVIIIDELADLMMAAPNEVEDSICRLAQMARAAGMHLVIATQRPSVDVITGVIKANIPSRIAFAVSSQVDSRTILDMGGAEKLLGRGDMLYYPVGSSKPIRVQGCFVTDTEVEKVVSFIKEGGQTDYNQTIVEEIDRHTVAEKSSSKNNSRDDSDSDEMLPHAIECVIEAGQASTSLLQRRLKLGYARAARIIDQMEEKGIVGPFEGSKPRQVLITRDRWIEMKLSGAENAQLSLSDRQEEEASAPF